MASCQLFFQSSRNSHMYHSVLLRVTIIVLDNSKSQSIALCLNCFILELLFQQVKPLMKLCSQENWRSMIRQEVIGPWTLLNHLGSFERTWECYHSNRFPWKTDSLSVKVLLQKMTVSFTERLPDPTATYCPDKYILTKHFSSKTWNLSSKCPWKMPWHTDSCWRGVDRFIMSNMKLYNSIKSEKVSHQPGKISLYQRASPNYTQRIIQGCFADWRGFMWSDTQKPHPKTPHPKKTPLCPLPAVGTCVSTRTGWKKKGTTVGCLFILSGTSKSGWNCFGSVPVSNGIWPEFYQFQIVSCTDWECRSINAKSVS